VGHQDARILARKARGRVAGRHWHKLATYLWQNYPVGRALGPWVARPGCGRAACECGTWSATQFGAVHGITDFFVFVYLWFDLRKKKISTTLRGAIPSKFPSVSTAKIIIFLVCKPRYVSGPSVTVTKIIYKKPNVDNLHENIIHVPWKLCVTTRHTKCFLKMPWYCRKYIAERFKVANLGSARNLQDLSVTKTIWYHGIKLLAWVAIMAETWYRIRALWSRFDIIILISYCYIGIILQLLEIGWLPTVP